MKLEILILFPSKDDEGKEIKVDYNLI